MCQFPADETFIFRILFLARECDLLRSTSNCHVRCEAAYHSPPWKDPRLKLGSSQMDRQRPHTHEPPWPPSLQQQPELRAPVARWTLRLGEARGEDLSSLSPPSNPVMTSRFWALRTQTCLFLTSFVLLPVEYQEIPPGVYASVDKTCLRRTDPGLCWECHGGSF